ncbi:MAG: HAD-IA family hydrolase [Micrococcales bacterium]|nr:HAD-IA family hydrolase [Micrococcales bacterium]
MSEGIDAVVWDMGGIFRRYFTEVLVDVGRERGWPVGRMALGPTGSVPDPDYDAMDAGEISEGEYYARVVERLHDEDIDFDPKRDPDWADEDRRAVWSLVHDIADSPLRQAVLTNDASNWLGPDWWETWPERRFFDAVVDVATIGVRKPAAGAFEHVLRLLDADPARTVFVDDMRVNCRGAEAVGIAAHHLDIRDADGSVAALRARLGLAAVPTP